MEVLVVQGLEHLLVISIAAGCHNHALGGIDADVFAIGVRCINADHLVAVEDQALHGGAIANLGSEVLDVRIHDGGDISFTAGVFAIGAMADGPLGVAGTFRHVPLKLHFHAVGGQ